MLLAAQQMLQLLVLKVALFQKCITSVKVRNNVNQLDVDKIAGLTFHHDILKLLDWFRRERMNPFTGLEDDTATKFAFAIQGILIIFFVVSPVVGKLLHKAVAKASSLVLIICTMLLLGNLIYMGMVYIAYPALPEGAIHEYVWIILSFGTAFSTSILVGRYMNWYLSDNFHGSIWAQEFENLAEEDMMPFDRRRKQEMERRKRA